MAGCQGAVVQYVIRYNFEPLRSFARAECRCSEHRWVSWCPETEKNWREVSLEELEQWELVHQVHES